MAADDFFLGIYMTAVGPGELLSRVTIPPGRRDGSASVTIGVDGTCLVSAACSLEGGPRIAIGCVAAVPHRPRSVEAAVGEYFPASLVQVWTTWSKSLGDEPGPRPEEAGELRSEGPGASRSTRRATCTGAPTTAARSPRSSSARATRPQAERAGRAR